MPSQSQRSLLPVIDHLQQMEELLNMSARANNLAIEFDARRCLQQLQNPGMFFATDMMRAYEYCRVTEQQVSVAVRAIARFISQPRQPGLIGSENNESSVGTAMMMMFACPVGFIISGIRYAPLYLTANNHRRLDETHARVRGFLKLYGDIGIKMRSPLAGHHMEGQDDGELDLASYLYGSLEANRYPSGEDFLKEIASAFTARRKPGGLTRNLETFRQWVGKSGYEPMIILENTLCTSQRSSGAGPTRRSPLPRVLAEIDSDILGENIQCLVIGISPGIAVPPLSRSAWLA